MARRRSDAEPSRELKGIQRTQLRLSPRGHTSILPPEMETPARGGCRDRRCVRSPSSYDLSRFTGKLNQPKREWRSGR